MDNYSKDKLTKNRDLVWLVFIFVSIFAQIIVLNMLIAIMGDTFDQVIENKALAKLKLKVKILSDFIFLLPEDSEKFLYLATPRMKESEMSTSWEGKITEIRRAFLGNFVNQRDVMAKKTKEIVNEIT